MSETQDKKKQLKDLQEELRATKGVENLIPLGGRDVNTAINTTKEYLNSQGSEIKDLMTRPRVTARETSEKKLHQRLQAHYFGRSKSVRVTKEIPK